GAAVRLNLGGAQGRPAGVFGAYQPELSGSQTQAVFLADLDGDGDLDALVAGKKQAAIWWNDGKGNFSPSKLRFNYSDRQALAVGDFNGDGRPDIFAGGSSYFGAAAVVWLNQGSGVFR
ncbi:MAG TPA: VCBS repeat-containing protein, partial [Anaerolineales bacterium]